MLTTTEAALLGLLRKGPLSGYDLRRHVGRSVGYFWGPAKTQMYATLPKLVAAGYATDQRVVQETRPDKTLYSITEAGEQALREWIEDAPLEAGQGRDVLLLKLFFAEGADVAALERQVAERRADAERLLSELEELEAAGAGGPHWEALTRRWGFLYAEALLRWTDEVADQLKRIAAARPRAS